MGLQTGPAPWNAGVDHLPDRLEPAGLNPLGAEGEVVHIHQHMDIYVNGKRVTVPTGIGIYDGQFLTELHTHDATGLLHVESPKKRDVRPRPVLRRVGGSPRQGLHRRLLQAGHAVAHLRRRRRSTRAIRASSC